MRFRTTTAIALTLPPFFALLVSRSIQADEYNAHKWTVYVRSPVNEDLSPAVKKVVFQLHHSFTEPMREVLEQPYELTETGWGEFEITATVHFVDEAMEEPFQLVHGLKLFHPNDQPLTTKKPVRRAAG